MNISDGGLTPYICNATYMSRVNKVLSLMTRKTLMCLMQGIPPFLLKGSSMTQTEHSFNMNLKFE